MLSRATLLRSSLLRSSSLHRSIIPSRSLHKGTDSTPPLRFFPLHEKQRYQWLLTRGLSTQPSLTRSELLELMQEASVAALNSPDPYEKEGCIVMDEATGEKLAADCNRGTHGMEYIPWSIPENITQEYRLSEEWLDTKYLIMLHAEMNALLKARNIHTGKKIVYTTLFPCHRCAKHIVAAGDVTTVIYKDSLNDEGSMIVSQKILEKAGIEVRKPIRSENAIMGGAAEVASKSPDTRTKVGSLVVCVKSGEIIASGFNTPSKGIPVDKVNWNASKPQYPTDWVDTKLPYTQHAGVGALIAARAKSHGKKIIFLTSYPCHECAITIANSDDVTMVVHLDDAKGISQSTASFILERAGIPLIKLNR